VAAPRHGNQSLIFHIEEQGVFALDAQDDGNVEGGRGTAGKKVMQLVPYINDFNKFKHLARIIHEKSLKKGRTSAKIL
jgi:hypothetical protein